MTSAKPFCLLQHFFVARMDMSVDSRPGEGHNEVVELNVHTEDKGPKNPHGAESVPLSSSFSMTILRAILPVCSLIGYYPVHPCKLIGTCRKETGTRKECTTGPPYEGFNVL